MQGTSGKKPSIFEEPLPSSKNLRRLRRIHPSLFFGAEDRRTPIFDLRSRRSTIFPTLIFDRRPSAPEIEEPPIFDLRPRRRGRRSDERREGGGGRRLVRRWGECFFEDEGVFDFSASNGEAAPYSISGSQERKTLHLLLSQQEKRRTPPLSSSSSNSSLPSTNRHLVLSATRRFGSSARIPTMKNGPKIEIGRLLVYSLLRSLLLGCFLFARFACRFVRALAACSHVCVHC